MVRAACLLVAGVLTALAPGCASSASSSTRLTTEDLTTIAVEVAEKLRGSDFLRGRGPESERIVIAVQRVENLSSDVVTEGERWYLMERLTSSLPLGSMARERNLVFVIPAEKLREAKARGAMDPDAARDRAPTHVMTATLRSATRAAGLDRTELYSCQYRVVELASGELVWVDAFEFKRTARGRSYD